MDRFCNKMMSMRGYVLCVLSLVQLSGVYGQILQEDDEHAGVCVMCAFTCVAVRCAWTDFARR